MTAHEARLLTYTDVRGVSDEWLKSRIEEAAREGVSMIRLVGVSLTREQHKGLQSYGYSVWVVTAPHADSETDPTMHGQQVFVATELSWI